MLIRLFFTLTVMICSALGTRVPEMPGVVLAILGAWWFYEGFLRDEYHYVMKAAHRQGIEVEISPWLNRIYVESDPGLRLTLRRNFTGSSLQPQLVVFGTKIVCNTSWIRQYRFIMK